MGAKEQEIVPLHEAFDVVLRGFHRRQVLEYIESLDEQLRFTSVDRAEALAQAADLRKLLEMTRQDLEDARARLSRLELSSDTAAGATERLRQMLALAEDEAAGMRQQAERDVAGLRARTEVELTELRRRVERRAEDARVAAARRTAELDQRAVELDRLRVEAEAQLRERAAAFEAECAARRQRVADECAAVKQQVWAECGDRKHAAIAEAEQLVRAARNEARRLENESRARRTAAEQDFELAMTRRRAEAARELAELEQASRARATWFVLVAAREAQRRTEEARARTEEVLRLRGELVDRVHDACATLTAAADHLVTGAGSGRVNGTANGTQVIGSWDGGNGGAHRLPDGHPGQLPELGAPAPRTPEPAAEPGNAPERAEHGTAEPAGKAIPAQPRVRPGSRVRRRR